MKQWKRLLSLVLVVCLIAGFGFVIPAVQADDPATPVYPTAQTWDFAGTTAEGWSLGAGYSVTDGKLAWKSEPNATTTTIKDTDGTTDIAVTTYKNSGTAAQLSDSANWTDYILSADVSMQKNVGEYFDSSNKKQSGTVDSYPWATLLVRGTIEVRVQGTTTANKYNIRVRQGSTDLTDNTGTKFAGGSFTVEGGKATDAATQVSFKLAAVVEGTQLTVLIDDVAVATFEDITAANGNVGIKTYMCNTCVLAADSVSYDNVSIAPAKEEEKEEGVLFSDDFAAESSDWTLGTGYAVADGKLTWTMNSTSGKTAVVTGVDGCAQWKDYTVTADVTVAKSENTTFKYPKAGFVMYGSASDAAISLRLQPHNDGKTYQVDVYENDGGNKYRGTLFGDFAAAALASDGTLSFQLTATMKNGALSIFVDGAQAADKTDPSITTVSGFTKYSAGSAGVIAFASSPAASSLAGETVSYDNFKVKAVEQSAEVEFGGTEVTIAEDANKTAEKYADGFIEADITLAEGNMANLTATGSKDGGDLSARWVGDDNYELRTRFLVTKTVPAEGAPTYTARLELIVYCTADFGVGKPQIFNHSLANFAWGNTYKVRLQVMGNTVKVFLDGEEVIAVTLASDSNMVDYQGYFGYLARTDFTSTYKNMKIVAVTPNTVTLGENVNTLASLPAYKQVGKTSVNNARSHFAKGETVTVTFSDVSTLDISTLRYTTATNTEGVKLTATGDEKVFTFEMTDEAVTIVCDKLAVADSDVLYTNDGTTAVTTSNWTDASIVNGADGLQFATLGNSKTPFYKTAITDGWIQVQYTLPTMSAEDIAKAKAVGTTGTSDVMYGVHMRDSSATTKGIKADIYYQRGSGTTVLRLRSENNAYSAKQISVSLDNSIWDSSKPVILKLRTIGNYVEALLTDATTGAVLANPSFTAGATTDVGAAATTWNFGMYYRSGVLYTNSAKTAEYQINTLAYVKNIEIAKINNTYTVAVDAGSAEAVSLPAVNELGTTTPLARDFYEAGEKLKLVLADGKDAANLKANGEAITDASAFEVPSENVTITYTEPVASNNTIVYENDGTANITSSDWGTAANTDGSVLKPTASTYYKTGLTDGWIEATFVLPTMTADDIVKIKAVGVSGTSNVLHGLHMLNASATTKSIKADIFFHRGNANTVLRLRSENNDYPAKEINVPLDNSIWDSSKPVTMKLRTVGNYIEVVLTDATSGTVLGTAGFTAAATTDVGAATATWRFGIGVQAGNLYTDSSKAAEYKVDTSLKVKNVTIGRIDNTYTVAVVSDAADKVSLPAVNELGTTTPLARDLYEGGEVLKLVLADDANAAYLKANGEVIADASAFEVPSENVTITYDEPVVSNNTIVYENDGTANITSSDWCTAANTDGSVLKPTASTYYKTGLTDGWIEATFILPTMTADDIVKIKAVGVSGTSNVLHGLHMLNASATTKAVKADIFFHRGNANTVLRLRSEGNAYAAKEINVSLDNSIWDSSKPVTMKLRTVGNYIEVVLTDATSGTVLGTAGFTAAATTDVGDAAAQWRFGIGVSAGNLYTDSSKAAEYKVDTSLKVKNVTIGRIDKTYTATVDAGATEYVSLPAVNELGTTVPLARDLYEGGEALPLTLASGAELQYLKVNDKAITDAAAYVMPSENVTITYDAPVVINSEVLYENDGTAGITTSDWGTALDVVAGSGVKLSAQSFYNTEVTNGWMSATIKLPTITAQQITEIKSATGDHNNAGSNPIYGVRMRDADRVAVTVQAEVLLNRTGGNTTFRLYIAANGYGSSAVNMQTTKVGLNAIWNSDAPVTIKLRKVGNYYEAVLTDSEGNVLASHCGTADTTKSYPLSNMTNNWQFGFTSSVGNIFTDFADQAGTKVDTTAYITDIQIGRINKTYTATLDTSAQGKVSLPAVDEFGSGALARNAYEAGEALPLSLFDGVDLVDVKVNDEAIADAAAFTMPSKNVTITYVGTLAPIVPPTTEEVENEKFEYPNGTNASAIFPDWSLTGGGNAIVTDQKLVLNAAYTALTGAKYRDGYIEADFTLVEPQAGMLATAGKEYNGGCLHARKTNASSSSQDLRTRFNIKQNTDGTYTAYLQLIVYSTADYGTAPQIHNYALSDFQWGNTYHVKLEAIGNFVRVYLDGAAIMEYTLADGLAGYSGYFCVDHLADTFVVAMDNLIVDSYAAYTVDFAANMDGILKTDVYAAVKTGAPTGRNAYLADDFVKLYVSAPVGYAIDDATLKYTGAVCGDVAITAKDSDILYGFKMPAENITVSAALKEADTAAAPINDTFDTESLMIDRSWGTEMGILQGSARAFGNYTAFMTKAPGCENWQSYTAQATINVTGTTGGTAVAALVVKSTDANQGYEYGIELGSGDLARLRVYDRANAKMLYYEDKATVELGKDVVLKLVVTGNTLTGYANGVWKFTLNVDDCTGGVGLKATKVNASFDNVIVTDIVSK